MKMWDRTHLFIAFNCYLIWTKFSACLVSCQTWMENSMCQVLVGSVSN